jgi:uncharacterized membrane protein
MLYTESLIGAAKGFLANSKGNTLKINLKAQDVAVIGICAALYAVFGRLTAGFSFLGVGFLPAVVIPAIFAVLYGPWVGGIGGAIGIFIRDMLVHGNAPLSLVAGVPPNFILFFLIGYLSHRELDIKKMLIGLVIAAVGLTVPLAIFLPDLATFTSLSRFDIVLTFSLTVILSLVIIGVVALRWKQWRSFAVAAVVAQAAGAGLLSVTVWAVSPYFLSYFKSPFPISFVTPLFVWTFATELPFIILVGPPIIKACYRAFPSLAQRSRQKGETIE